jgi:hypothetical protein
MLTISLICYHPNTELEMIRELAGNDSAYRSLVIMVSAFTAA